MITLTTPITVSITGPNPFSESDTTAGCTLLDVDYNNQIATFTFRQGTASGSTLTPGLEKVASTVTFTVNMVSGEWHSFDSLNPLANKSGTFSGAGFTTFVNQLKAIRNSVETFVAGASGILPGTQANWP